MCTARANSVAVEFQWNSPFHALFFSFALQCNLTLMRGNFGVNLHTSPKLPRIHARFYCIANEQSEKVYSTNKIK